MKYKIERTSGYGYGETQPCKNAYKGEKTEWEQIWYIDINTLEELQQLIQEVRCRVIVGKTSMEIYDDYRE